MFCDLILYGKWNNKEKKKKTELGHRLLHSSISLRSVDYPSLKKPLKFK